MLEYLLFFIRQCVKGNRRLSLLGIEDLGGMIWISEKPLDLWGWQEGEVSISFVVVMWNSLKFFFLKTYFLMKLFWICQMQFFNQTNTITKQAYSKFRNNDQSQACKAGKQKLRFWGMPKDSGSAIRSEILNSTS